MSYWNKIKNFLSLSSDPEKKEEEIVFSPEELREMRDPNTAVGRLLNPYDVDYHAHGGARELFYKGLGSPEKSTLEETQNNEIVGPIADAYIKDAIKRGIIHPDEDRITQNYKIIEDLKKRKNLEHIKIKHGIVPPNTWGVYHPEAKQISLKESIFPLTLSKNKKNQKDLYDRHLKTSIHELRHAEDLNDDPDDLKNNPRKYDNHFKEAAAYLGENSDDVGQIFDIEKAALQRLANMGKKKNE